MDRSRSFGSAMAAYPARKRKLLEEPQQTIGILAFVGIDLRIRALEVKGAEDPRRAMARTRHKNHVEIVFADQSIQVAIYKGQRRASSPVPKQPIFYVFRLERLAKKWIVLQIDHAQRKVIASAPEGMRLTRLFTA